MEITPGFSADLLPVPLAWLAKLDDSSSGDALPDALGDSYLCAHNPVFAKIRRSAIGFGFRYSCEDTQAWRDYQSFGLVALQQIVSGRIIPYHDTGSAFRRLLERTPKVALSPRFILNGCKKNYVLHESAHCIASSVLRLLEPQLRAIEPGEGERFVLEAIFAEAFACTVETLGSLVKSMPLTDSLFYSLNSYVIPVPARTRTLEDAAAKTGEYTRFALLFLASFEANLTAAEPDQATMDRICSVAECGDELSGESRAIAGIAFRLSSSFRELTTPEYFNLLGYGAQFGALTQSRWLGAARNRQFLRELVLNLFSAAVACIPQPTGITVGML